MAMASKAICPLTGLQYRVMRRSKWEDSIPAAERTVSFEISTGNPNCSGTPLQLQMNWAVAKARRFEFSLGDTLRVHNYTSVGHPEFGVLSETEAEAVAKSDGDAWIEANKSSIASILQGAQYEIVRWSDWKSRPGYESYFAELKLAYASDRAFAAIVRQDLISYLARQRLRFRSFRPASDEAVIDRLAQYLLEELAVYAIQAARGNTINVYPGGQMKVFKRMNEFAAVPAALKRRHYAYFEIK